MNGEFLERLRESLDYNPETGEFRWKVSKSGNKGVGSLAGRVNSLGRLQIKFEGRSYYAHRLAWLLTHNKWPDDMIDHVDGDPLNNRITNLRDVSRSVNGQNQREAMSNSKTGVLGVTIQKQTGRFKVTIGLNGVNKHLGYFSTIDEATSVYLAAKRELHEGCTI